ncbi:hypothetical protein [Streptomyces sennicomposti]
MPPQSDGHLRYVDGLDDTAFLAMDLERLRVPEDAEHFLSQCGEHSGLPPPFAEPD